MTEPLSSRVAGEVREVLDEIKPRLRGWLHAVFAVVAVLAGVPLVVSAPGTSGKVAVAVFIASSVLLFTVSAFYHTRTWPERVRVRLRRWDHANIFVLIAGSYTPFAVLMLPDDATRNLLITVWAGALIGVAFHLLWIHAPRWLYVPIYIALGWAAVLWASEFAAADEPWSLSLVALGGVLYTLGAVVYGLKRPNPAPQWFGFHEIFHAMTIAAFIAHYIGVWLLL